MRRRTYLIVALVIVVLATAIAFRVFHGSGTVGPRTLVWGGPRNISMIAIIADKKGFFEKEGLDIRSNYVQTGKIAMDAIVSGDLDFGVIVDTNIAFVEFQEGADIQVIAAIAEKYDDAIVARRDLGIENPKDLEGKTLAILPGTTSHRFADLFVDFYGLDRSKIKFVNLSPPSIQAGILNGSIPAGSVWQPFRYNVEQALGDRAVQFNDRAIYKAYSLIAVRRPFSEEHAKEIEAFLRALIAAEDFIRSNVDEAIGILSEELRMAPEVLRAIWDEYDLRVQLDTRMVQVFTEEGEWIKRSQKGFESKQVPSYNRILESKFLEHIDASRVINTGR